MGKGAKVTAARHLSVAGNGSAVVVILILSELAVFLNTSIAVLAGDLDRGTTRTRLLLRLSVLPRPSNGMLLSCRCMDAKDRAKDENRSTAAILYILCMNSQCLNGIL